MAATARMIRTTVFLALAAGALAPDAAEAWPFRSPVVRAERRVARAQAAMDRLDRELDRSSARLRVAEQRYEPGRARAIPPAAPFGAAPVVVEPPAVVRPAAPGVAGEPRPTPAAGGVARATYETLPRPAPSPTPAAAPQPAEDGTVSVLAQPNAERPAQPSAPLRFPDADSR